MSRKSKENNLLGQASALLNELHNFPLSSDPKIAHPEGDLQIIIKLVSTGR